MPGWNTSRSEVDTDLDGLEGAQRALTRRDLLARTVDVLLGSVLLLLALPLILVTAVGSAVALRAWPFFVQDRIGRNGEVFRFVKVRTLPRATDAYADKYALAEVRIPAFTRVLRSLHLDELPQLALVVVGKMSLVGPRPEMPGLHATLAKHVATARTLVRPGCTGLWQVSAACNGLISEAPQYDAFYIQHRSVRFDLWILAQTALKVVRGGHTQLTLEDVPGWVSAPAEPGRPALDVVATVEATLDRVIDLTALTAAPVHLQDLDA